MRFSKLITAAATLAGGAQAFFRMECQGRLAVSRMDPMMAPGHPAEHAHSIHGSSGFSMTTSYQDLRDGDCTSCRVTQDKSAYWHPAMYFQDTDTGEFELVEQVGGMLAYYQYHLNNLTAFPPGFRMIAGDAKRRNWTSWDPSKPDPVEHEWSALGIETQQSYLERSVGFNCLNYGGQAEPTLYRHYLPDQKFIQENCPNGIRTEVNFPSCWNGKDRDSEDHRSHVAFPDRIRSGNCPEGFDVHLPNLLYEVIWNTKNFAGRNGRFVMSNGDALGYGYHGDFIAGWDEGFLQQVLETCTNESGNIVDCPLFDIVSEDVARQCSIDVPDELKDEDVVGPRASLPGELGIIWEDHVEGGGKPISSDVLNTISNFPPNQLSTYEYVPVIPTPNSPEAAPVESTPSPAPSPIPSGDFGAAHIELAPVAAEPSPEPPATTPAPVPEPVTAEESKYFVSTQTVTQGNVVSIIYWEEEIVYVTEYEDITTTLTVTAQPSAVTGPPSEEPDVEARDLVHGHAHRHLHRHRRRAFP
ncbi:WSC domain-containing protein [Plectosphaerella plurivora]|uniref:WSC domain-containing protein n=1 Tax=Plectosphaerella plurivora TaxID=936078 RepID=A0A9P9ACQ7_9PEZI|nr:WSC domain-containing protein [Plectosphaerella plurivora]